MKKLNVFLDSGAFSAWTQGKKLDIRDYVRFIQNNLEDITAYANFDVIGNPIKTWENQLFMEDQGLRPMPCYHYGEHTIWMERYIKHGYDYIAFGGMVPIATVQLKKWLDRIFGEVIADKNGCPTIKVHGFGLSSFPLTVNYPWYSIDSSKWVKQAAFGYILMPPWSDSKVCWDYTRPFIPVRVSGKTGKTGLPMPAGSDYRKQFSEWFFRYIKEKGFELGASKFSQRPDSILQDLEVSRKTGQIPEGPTEVILKQGLCNDGTQRSVLNAIYFIDLAQSLPKWPWPFRSSKERSYAFNMELEA